MLQWHPPSQRLNQIWFFNIPRFWSNCLGDQHIDKCLLCVHQHQRGDVRDIGYFLVNNQSFFCFYPIFLQYFSNISSIYFWWRPASCTSTSTWRCRRRSRRQMDIRITDSQLVALLQDLQTHLALKQVFPFAYSVCKFPVMYVELNIQAKWYIAIYVQVYRASAIWQQDD